MKKLIITIALCLLPTIASSQQFNQPTPDQQQMLHQQMLMQQQQLAAQQRMMQEMEMQRWQQQQMQQQCQPAQPFGSFMRGWQMGRGGR